MPREGEVVRELPPFLDGVYQDETGFTHYEIVRINQGHCVVQSYQSIPKDSLLAFVENSKSDTMSAEIKGSTVIVSSEDTTYQMNFVLIDGFYETERAPLYEINLNDGYFIHDFTENEKKKVSLRKYKNDYFMNIVMQENWLLVRWQYDAGKLMIAKSIVADSTFSETNTYYNGITKIMKLDGQTYLANPDDEEFFALLAEPKLFQKEVWIRAERAVVRPWHWYAFFAMLGVALVLSGIVIYLINRKK